MMEGMCGKWMVSVLKTWFWRGVRGFSFECMRT